MPCKKAPSRAAASRLPVTGALFVFSALILGLVLVAAGRARAQVQPHLDTDLHPAAAAVSEEGFIPPAFGTAHYARAAAKAVVPGKALPVRYDTRELGLVSSVKNQQDCGACYAFSSAADLESKILRAGLPEFDLSENSLKECHYQGSGCNGGNQYRIVNYLATQGAVLETCDPYVPSDVTCTLGCANQFVVLDYCAVSGSTLPAVDVIKQYMLDHGPIHSALFAGDDTAPTWRDQVFGYDGTGVLYYTGTQTPNHSILIVGWDDAKVHAGGTGAWIVKNSWGTSWGGTCDFGTEDGYFYIAYGSGNIGMYSSYVNEFMADNPVVGLMYHDEGGYTTAFGGLGTVLWGMAAFSATESTRLHRVEFWTSDATVDVDVYVYADFAGGDLSTLLASSLNNSFAEPGYHYVELEGGLPLTPSQDFYVAVKFENESYVYPLTADGDGVTDAGSSYYSFNGFGWSTLEIHGVDTTIRVRTSPNEVLALEDREEPEVEPDGGVPPAALGLDGAWPNPFNPATNITYHLPHDGRVTLAIFDLKGRRVRTLVDEIEQAGSRTVLWDGRDDSGVGVPSGVYFCKVFAADQVRGIKLALLK